MRAPPRAVDLGAEPLSLFQLAVARQVTHAWMAPSFRTTIEVGMAGALARLRTLREQPGAPSITLTDVLVHHVARTLLHHPNLNAHYDDERITRFGHVHMGLAVATARGVVVPVLHDADQLTEAEIAGGRHACVARARSGGLTSDDLLGGTFTISNLGMYGIDSFDAIINVPQVAILAVAAVRPRVRLRENEVVEEPVCHMTLTCDHRVTDGAAAAAFLADMRATLEAAIDDR